MKPFESGMMWAMFFMVIVLIIAVAQLQSRMAVQESRGNQIYYLTAPVETGTPSHQIPWATAVVTATP